MPSTRATPHHAIVAALLAGVAVLWGGCNTTPRGDPFAVDDRNVEVQPSLRAAIAGVAGLVGFAVDSVSFGDTDVDAAAARLADDQSPPDVKRRAIDAMLSEDLGRTGRFTKLLREVAADPSNEPIVRATAVRALNRTRADAADAYVALLDDESPLVRLESAKALWDVTEPSAAGPLLARATDERENLDVRLAAIEALRRHPQPEVVERLAAFLTEEPFSLAFQSRVALAFIFGEDRGYDPEAWLDLELPQGRPVGTPRRVDEADALQPRGAPS